MISVPVALILVGLIVLLAADRTVGLVLMCVGVILLLSTPYWYQ